MLLSQGLSVYSMVEKEKCLNSCFNEVPMKPILILINGQKDYADLDVECFICDQLDAFGRCRGLDGCLLNAKKVASKGKKKRRKKSHYLSWNLCALTDERTPPTK